MNTTSYSGLLKSSRGGYPPSSSFGIEIIFMIIFFLILIIVILVFSFMNIIEQERIKNNKKSENTDNKKSENTDNKKSENINLKKNKYNLPNCSPLNWVCKNRKRAVENFSKTNEILEFENNVPEKYLLENYLCHNTTDMSYNVLRILNLYKYFYPSYFYRYEKNFNNYEKEGKKNYEEIRKNLNSYKFIIDKAIINYLKEVLNNAYQYYKKMISFIKKNGLKIDDPKYWEQLLVSIKGKKSREEGLYTDNMCSIIQKQSICKEEQDSNKLSFDNLLISNYKKEMNFPKCQFTQADNSWQKWSW